MYRIPLSPGSPARMPVKPQLNEPGSMQTQRNRCFSGNFGAEVPLVDLFIFSNHIGWYLTQSLHENRFSMDIIIPGIPGKSCISFFLYPGIVPLGEQGSVIPGWPSPPRDGWRKQAGDGRHYCWRSVSSGGRFWIQQFSSLIFDRAS